MAAPTSSLVHPKYKTKYSIKNWSEYEQGLRDRGDVTIWFGEDAISGWTRRGERSRGAQRRYSDLAIEAALTLGLLFQLPLRRISALSRVGHLWQRCQCRRMVVNPCAAGVRRAARTRRSRTKSRG